MSVLAANFSPMIFNLVMLFVYGAFFLGQGEIEAEGLVASIIRFCLRVAFYLSWVAAVYVPISIKVDGKTLMQENALVGFITLAVHLSILISALVIEFNLWNKEPNPEDAE